MPTAWNEAIRKIGQINKETRQQSDQSGQKLKTVKVKMETRFFIECPNGCCEVDVDTYEISVFECPECHGKWQYNSEPENCEEV